MRLTAAAAAAINVVLRIWVSPLRDFSQRRHGTYRPYHADVAFHPIWYRLYLRYYATVLITVTIGPGVLGGGRGRCVGRGEVLVKLQ
jgi:hypothetical protein